MSKGNYKCEVSTDAPNFPTVVEDANMTVIGKINNVLILYYSHVFQIAIKSNHCLLIFLFLYKTLVLKIRNFRWIACTRVLNNIQQGGRHSMWRFQFYRGKNLNLLGILFANIKRRKTRRPNDIKHFTTRFWDVK